MNISFEFLGGASAIGASSCLLKVGSTRVLIDCGIRFEKDRPLPDIGRLGSDRLDAVFVTHAHSDHTGALAFLHAHHPGVPIYMTDPTRDLVRILQLDALKIMDAEERSNELPLYREEDVQSLLEQIVPVKQRETVEAGCVRVTFLPAGHILGAAMLFIETPAGTVLFTGDYSVKGQLTVPDLRLPRLPVDVLITESTYGSRLHSDRRTSEDRLVRQIASVVEGGGRVLIPAFAIGRAQELLMILRRAMRSRTLPKIPVYVDGMVRHVCEIYARFPEWVSRFLRTEIERRDHPFFDAQIRPVRPDERRDLPSTLPCIIVSSSGMLTGGPSSLYASRMLEHEKDAIFITGYQDEESPGRKLLNLAASTGPDRSLAVAGRTLAVKCQFEAFQLSAHADKAEILGLVDHLKPRSVFLVHGDAEAKLSLRASLQGRVRDVVFADEIETLTRSYPLRKAQMSAALTALTLGERKSAQTDMAVEPAENFMTPSHQHAQNQRADAEGSSTGNDESGLTAQTDAASSPKCGTDDRMNGEEQLWPMAKTRLLEAVRLSTARDAQFLSRNVGPEALASVRVTEGDKQILESPSLRARTIEEAEGLAATWALQHLFPDVDMIRAKQVPPELATGRRKGELNEVCMKAGVPLPEVAFAVCREGYLAQVKLRFGRFEHIGDWCIADTRREAEFGAFKIFLDTLTARAEQKQWQVVPFLRRHITPDLAVETPLMHPTSQLNQWEQARLVTGLHTQIEATGSAHSPTFTASASVQLTTGGVLSVRDVKASSKKEATQKAHQLLVEHVKTHQSQSN